MAEQTFKLRIKPEVSAADAKRFIEDLRQQAKDAGVGSISAPAGGGKGGALAGAASGGALAGAIAGIGAAVGVGAALAFKEELQALLGPVLTILKTIVRVLLEFLRPISDVLILLLAPILSILRPFLIIFRAIIQPFRQAAFQLLGAGQQQFAAGNEAEAIAIFMLAFQTLFTGIQAVVLTLIGDILGVIVDAITDQLAFITDIIITLVAAIVAIFSDSGAQAVLDFGQRIREGWENLAEFVKDGIDAGIAGLITAQAEGIATVGEELGVNMEDFRSNVSDLIDGVIIDDENSIWQSMKGNIENLRNNVVPEIDKAFDDIADAIVDGVKSLPGKIARSAGRSIRSSFSSYGASPALTSRI